jgi:hypothetical protein
MTLTASEVVSLTNSIYRWECAEYLCTALVAVACFGEYIADFTEWWRSARFWEWFGPIEHRKDAVGKFSTLVLIGALAGELLCVVKTNQLSSQLVGALGDTAQEAFSKSRDALKNANTAVLKADSAAKQSSMAVVDSATARKDALAAERQVLSVTERASKLEARLAWRTIDERQRAQIVMALRVFGPRQIGLGTVNANAEVSRFRDDLTKALHTSGIEAIPLASVLDFVNPFPPVLITAGTNAMPLARAIRSALIDANVIHASDEFRIDPWPRNADLLEMQIGPRP